MGPHPKPHPYQQAAAAAAFHAAASYPGRGSHPGPLPPPGSLAFHQFEAAARAQAAANPNLRHISPLGPAQMLAIAQSREREVQQEKERTMALMQYQEALMRAGQPPLQSGPMAIAGPTLPAPSSVAPLPPSYGQGSTLGMGDRSPRSQEDSMRYRYGRDSATPPVDSSEGNNTNYRSDVQLGDKDLIDIETKDLNKRLKKANVSKDRMKAIKAERRTLKNRGYASSCRIKREKEVENLEEIITRDKMEIQEYEDEIFSIKQATEALDQWFEKMDPILEHMDRQLAQHGGYDSEADSESGGVKNEEDFVFV